METKSFNQWLQELGYRYVDGEERLMKGTMTKTEAEGLIILMQSEGAVTRG